MNVLDLVEDEDKVCRRLGATYKVHDRLLGDVELGDRGRAFTILITKLRRFVAATNDRGFTDHDWIRMHDELERIVSGHVYIKDEVAL